MPVTTRRDFLKLGALFVPLVAAPTVAYSFLWARHWNTFDYLAELYGADGRYPGENDDALSARLRQMWNRKFTDAQRIPNLSLRADGSPLWTLEPWPSQYPGERPSVRIE